MELIYTGLIWNYPSTKVPFGDSCTTNSFLHLQALWIDKRYHKFQHLHVAIHDVLHILASVQGITSKWR